MRVIAAGDDLGVVLAEQGESGDLVADGVGRLDLDGLALAAPEGRSPNGATIRAPQYQERCEPPRGMREEGEMNSCMTRSSRCKGAS